MSFEIYNYVLIVLGLFMVWGVLAKPVFYWDSRRVTLFREMVGDTIAVVVDVVIGCLLAGAGLLSALGVIALF